MNYLLKLHPLIINFFDMNYPTSNTQGRIHAMADPNNAFLFYELIPHSNSLLGKFLFKKGVTFKFQNRIGEDLRKGHIYWQIDQKKQEYFVPVSDSFFSSKQQSIDKDIVIIRIQM